MLCAIAMTNLFPTLVSPLRPALREARHYSFFKLRKDIVAGLTVAVVEVPQAMAYALIAGVPPQYGIYTSIIQGIFGALLSSSEHLTTGPTNTQSLLIASAVTRLASMSGHLPPEQMAVVYLQMVFGLTLLKGIIQLLFAAVRLGAMVRYVSRSVIYGVAAGAGVLIIVGQLPNLLGITIPSTTERHLPGALGAMERLWPHLDQVNPRALALGVGCLAVVVGVRWISRFLPGALLAVVLAAVTVAVLGWEQSGGVMSAGGLTTGGGGVPTIEPIEPHLPSWQIPWMTWGQAEELLGGALALALLGMLESVAIVKSIASKTGDRIDPNQEFFAQGFTNFVSSFFQCIPGSGSFTRSALDHDAGAQTRYAAMFNAVFVGAIFFFFAGLAKYIPLASLAAVLLIIAAGLIDFGAIRRLWTANRSDGIVCLATAAATMLLPLEFAIFIGIFLSLALYIRQTSRLHLSEMQHRPGGIYIERPLQSRSGESGVLFLQLEGDLFFGIADELQDRLSQVAQSNARVVIVRLKRTLSVDSTVLAVMEDFAKRMRSRGGHVILCGLKPELLAMLQRYGLVAVLGSDNVFATGFGVFTSAKQALQRARKLIGDSIDVTGLDFSDDDGWMYEI